MNNRRSIIAVIVVLTVLSAPLAAFFAADDSAAASASNDISTDYREQLEANGKAMYDAMESLSASDLKNYTLTVMVDLPCPVGVETEDVSTAPSSDEQATVTEILTRYADDAWQATKLDDPYAFWTWSYDSASDAVTVTLGDYSTVDSSYVYSDCTVSIRVSTAYGTTGDNLAAMVQAVHDAVGEITTIDGSGWSLVQSINSYLCSSTIAYDTDMTNNYRSSVYGAFVSETDGVHYIVCEGFAMAFKLLCDQYGINCKVVFGNANLTSLDGGSQLHAWNLVEIAGGNGTCNGEPCDVYAVDTTWNNTAGDSTAYLGVGTATETDGITFAQSHSPWYPYYAEVADNYAFLLPDTSSTAYEDTDDSVSVFMAYMPWVIVVIIALLLGGVLYSMGRKQQKT
ncbi:MAG: hypothetical protein PHT00_02255 [Candidatus Methanomethylophilus sp.]|nr:hypothetical protein [Methanomethylophilus sp.]MDD3232978.1 hypothetical protein [Methanomethylophilus sp.]MDD4668795.1 hypothetical protein [Methanomethylophilus sp.]